MTDAACRIVTADRGDAGRRLDLVLRRHLTDVRAATRTQVQAWIEGGRVTVNGKAVHRVAVRTAFGDVVSVALPSSPAAPMAAEDVALQVLYEDDHLLAVDKPAGLVVHPAHKNPSGTLMNALLWHARAWPEGQRPSLVGRLDKLTSGLVLVAKSAAIHTSLQKALASSATTKDYLAVVYGKVNVARGDIHLHGRRTRQCRHQRDSDGARDESDRVAHVRCRVGRATPVRRAGRRRRRCRAARSSTRGRSRRRTRWHRAASAATHTRCRTGTSPSPSFPRRPRGHTRVRSVHESAFASGTATTQPDPSRSPSRRAAGSGSRRRPRRYRNTGPSTSSASSTERGSGRSSSWTTPSAAQPPWGRAAASVMKSTSATTPPSGPVRYTAARDPARVVRRQHGVAGGSRNSSASHNKIELGNGPVGADTGGLVPGNRPVHHPRRTEA